MSDRETWQDRLKSVLGPGGYADSYMRRSLQTVVLYEAMRCIQPHLDILRPFQKRALLLMQVHKLLDSLDFLTPRQREEVLWRTQKKGDTLTDENAWSRVKNNQKYLRKTLEQLRPFIIPGQTHQESVNAMVRQFYQDSMTGKSTTGDRDDSVAPIAPINPPPNWEFFHNHTILTLRIYYDGEQLVADFPRMEPGIAMVPLQRNNNLPETDSTEGPSNETHSLSKEALSSLGDSGDSGVAGREGALPDVQNSGVASLDVQEESKSEKRKGDFTAAAAKSDADEPGLKKRAL